MKESILQEAHRLTHGPRRKNYGHPLDDYTRTAALMSAMLAGILKRPLTAHEAALLMCCVKLSREIHCPKRDNMVDLSGYAWVARECLEEGERRESMGSRSVRRERPKRTRMLRSTPGGAYQRALLRAATSGGGRDTRRKSKARR